MARQAEPAARSMLAAVCRAQQGAVLLAIMTHKLSRDCRIPRYRDHRVG